MEYDQHQRDLRAGEIVYVVAADLLGETIPRGATRMRLADISKEDREEAERLAKGLIDAISKTKRDWAGDARGRGLVGILGGFLSVNPFEIFNGMTRAADAGSTRATAQEVHAMILDMWAGRPLSLNGRSLQREDFGDPV